MALPVVDAVVEGTRFQITVLDAVMGRRLYLRLLKAVAPGLAKLAKLAGLKDHEDESAMLGALASAIESLDVQLFDDLCEAMAAGTRMPRDDGSSVALAPVFGVFFAGKYNLLMQWLLAALNANKFLDFLPESFAHGSAGSAKP